MSEKNPWKTTGSEVIYENPWLRLREDKVIRPDGNPGIYSVIETRIAVGVVALTTNGEICLVGQYRYPTERYSWEIVEGGTDDDEKPLETGKRELQEEAGFLAKTWTPLGDGIQVSNCISNEIAVFYLAEDLTEVEPSPDGTEVLQRRVIPLSDALEMVRANEISDAMSIVGLYRAQEYLAARDAA